MSGSLISINTVIGNILTCADKQNLDLVKIRINDVLFKLNSCNVIEHQTGKIERGHLPLYIVQRHQKEEFNDIQSSQIRDILLGVKETMHQLVHSSARINEISVFYKTKTGAEPICYIRSNAVENDVYFTSVLPEVFVDGIGVSF